MSLRCLARYDSTHRGRPMRKTLILACCAAFIGGVSAASAQMSGPAGQHTMQTGDSMNSNARMMRSDRMMMKKKMMMRDKMMKRKMMKRKMMMKRGRM